MNQSKKVIGWGDFAQVKNQHSYLDRILESMGMDESTKLNVADKLNELVNRDGFKHKELPVFVDQSLFDDEQRYYEQIIAELGQVPTRESSWHDFFNGTIWLQFPRTKKLLNRIHMSEIEQHGLHPRTLTRNQITHFDECGLILVGTAPEARSIIELLKNHQWEQALFAAKEAWHTVLHPIIFGHANLEMLLNPFLSLTAKWLYIECFDIDLYPSEMPSLESRVCIDVELKRQIQQRGVFTQKGHLKPLPILGVPGWHENQNSAFYNQTKIFRPLNQ